MQTCPNCSYKLVLLSNRMKYKCAKCSRLFSQKKIENKEFREWNKLQRKIKLEDSEKEFNKEYDQLKSIKKSIIPLFKGLSNNNKEARKEYYLRNRDKCLELFRVYYLKNKERISNRRKTNRSKNLEDSRRNDRILWWRRQQNKLTLQFFENNAYKPPTNRF